MRASSRATSRAGLLTRLVGGLALDVERGHVAGGGGLLGHQRRERRLHLVALRGDGPVARDGAQQPVAGEVLAQLLVAAGAPGLRLERAQALLLELEHVTQALEVLVGPLELLLGLLAALLVAGDAGGLLEDAAPVLGVGHEQGVDAAPAP